MSLLRAFGRTQRQLCRISVGAVPIPGNYTKKHIWGRHCFSTDFVCRSLFNEKTDTIIRSPYGAIPVPTDISVTDFLLQRIAQAPVDKAAFINNGTGESISYQQLGEKIQSLAASLSFHGVGSGDVVITCLPNNLEMALLILSIPATGACIAPMNPQVTKEDAEALLDKGPGTYLITKQALLPNFSGRASMFKQIFTVEDSGEHKSVTSLIKEGKPSYMPNVKIDPIKDEALIAYSSGTTGLPKGAYLSHYNIVASVLATSIIPAYRLFDCDDVLVNIFPLAHIGGNVIVLMSILYNNATCVLMEQFDMAKYLEANEKYKATTLVVPPTVATRMLTDQHCLNDYDLSSIREVLCGAAPVSLTLQEGLMKKMGLKSFRQVYGMSEMAGVTHIDVRNDFKLGSVGVPLPNILCKIADPETGVDLPPASTGEVYISGPSIMLGYKNNPEATAEMITSDGWLKTGDIGHHDDDGKLYITDRCKDLIKYKGYQVAPAELEGIILGHPLVLDVGVIGVLDNKAGEVPKAFIVLQTGVEANEKTAKGIIQYVKDRVTPYKQLRGGLSFVKDIPKLASGKILRRMLRQMAK